MMRPRISLIFFLLLNKLQFGVALTLTQTYAERLAQAASLSYLTQDKMSTSPYSGTCDLEPLYQFVDPVSESGATVFVDQQNPSTLVVACRGSANPKNFGTNLKFKLVPATRLSQNTIPDDAMVHGGFQDAAIGLWRQMGATLIDLLVGKDDESSFSEIIFTGHSLGAATALLCAVHYNASVNKKDDPAPSVVTFGGPKLCNGSLARHLRNEGLKGCDVLHLVHSKDPVLANNQKLWDSMGFDNVGIELDCDPTSPIVYMDGKKPEKKGLFGNFAWNIVDHCNYMGVFVGPRMR